MNITKKPEYSILAHIYDGIMEDVDYEVWADFIDAVIQQHHSRPRAVMELACGTGSVSLSLDELECYTITGTDKSEQMIARAREKNQETQSNVRFEVMDFLSINSTAKYDIVFSVFDSINYLLSGWEVLQFLKQAKKLLKSSSLLIFDFTTPKNSVKAVEYLHNEEGYCGDNYRFFRESRYNAKEQIHTNTFLIEKIGDDGETVLNKFQEIHRQKIYTLQQILDIIAQTSYNVIAKYDEFCFEEADANSLRITMVLQCPNIQ